MQSLEAEATIAEFRDSLRIRERLTQAASQLIIAREGLPEGEDSWKLSSLCLQVDPVIFHPESPAEADTAKKVCNSCEVRPECLTEAFETGDDYFGVRGGFTVKQRRRLKKTRAA